MRLACPEARLDSLPIGDVALNLDCRDEIIPILRGLQHVYADARSRRRLLSLVGDDVNRETHRRRGRRGMNYWEIVVLAAVRLGCNLDYDKLQDLAENHRRLRQIMGIGGWQEDEVDFDWRRIEDNISKLRPATLQKINALIVEAGHVLKPKAIESVRGDTFVAETNIHYPTESTLIGDGLRKIALLGASLAATAGVAGWRQAKHLLKKVRRLVRQIGRSARDKERGANQRRAGYRKLLQAAAVMLERARQLLGALGLSLEGPEYTLERVKNRTVATRVEKLACYVVLTTKVCDNARRRVLQGETLANEEKIFSIFEPHTELIKRNKQPNPIQFGHKVLVVEDAEGFVVDYCVLDDGVLDQDVVIPVMKRRGVNNKRRATWRFAKRVRGIRAWSRRSALCRQATA